MIYDDKKEPMPNNIVMIIAIGLNHPTVLVIAGIASLIVAEQEFFASVIDFFANVGEYLSSIGDIEISAPD